ncbi:MAG: hypothetical protein KY468_11940 [Armatimonadetes bacterium]|nr:hypothetical protein [Armatimonadota bacterium]
MAVQNGENQERRLQGEPVTDPTNAEYSGRVIGSGEEREVLGETADAGVDPTLVGASSTRTGSTTEVTGGDDEGVEGVAVIRQ